MYAKSLKPKLSREAGSLISLEYVKIREKKDSKNLTVNITPRLLETLIRLSTAFAKLRLSETVDLADAQEAIELLNNNLIRKVVKSSTFKKIKVDNDLEEPITLGKSLREEAMSKIRDLIYEWKRNNVEEQYVDFKDLSEAISVSIEDIMPVLTDLSDRGFLHFSEDGIFFLD